MYQKILVPLNGSDTSRRGFREAIRLAKLTNGSLRLFHVVDESFALAMDAYASCSRDWLNTLREDGTKLLQDAKAQAGAAGIAAEVVLHDNFNGKVAELVAAEAMNWPADLIVLGTRGRRGLRRVILGSKAENILRTAPVPVLLVRSPEEGGVAETLESACVSICA
ncbi:MAG: universal stress protein [Comamonadaceae bacterium]|nr:MAG: universal stress protein [Comamonadaceae bacterium]